MSQNINIYSITVDCDCDGSKFELYTYHNWMNARNLQSKTFQVPTDSEIQNLRINDRIKICNGIERFFVKIVDIDYSNEKLSCIRAIITTNLFYDYPYDYGNLVLVHPENIYSIFKHEEVEIQSQKYKNAISTKNTEQIKKMIDILENPTKLVNKEVN